MQGAGVVAVGYASTAGSGHGARSVVATAYSSMSWQAAVSGKYAGIVMAAAYVSTVVYASTAGCDHGAKSVLAVAYTSTAGCGHGAKSVVAVA